MLSFTQGLLHKLDHHHKYDKQHHHKHHKKPHYSNRKVFAHYMVGLTDGQSSSQWTTEILAAHEAGIDGFALNIGPSDYWTLTQLRKAYAAASSAVHPHGNFVLFLSLDMAAGQWSIDQVTSLINEFKDSPSQCKVKGEPLVSTFEGPDWAPNWETVRKNTGGIFLMPDWSSLGPHGVGQMLGAIDGAFSWGAWPRANQDRITTEEDIMYKNELRGKAYMMGISPWFYTRLPQWNKNWYSSGESLWYDRWMQILEVKPDFVEIITWNDYGESSHIYEPSRPSQVVPGADIYINGSSHSAFRAVLPYFIAAYKAGNHKIDLPTDDCAIAWYRPTPAGCGSDGDTVWGQGGSQSAQRGAKDVISIMAVVEKPTTLVVGIGDWSQEFKIGCHRGPVSFNQVPYNGRTGAVSLRMNGKTTRGAAISNTCPPCGYVTFNCTTIQV